MNVELKDKVAIVTGGTRGIGYAIARALLREGAKVFICGRQDAQLKSAMQSLSAGGEGSIDGVNIGRTNIDGIVADVSLYQDCRKLVEAAVNRFGGLDILVN